VAKVPVVIKRNAGYEKGMYGLSIHDQPGGSAPVIAVENESNLCQRLLELKLTEEFATAIIAQLQKKHDDVKFYVDRD